MEFLPGVHIVPGIVWSSVYLIEGETLVLVDSGLPWTAGKVLRYVDAIGRKPSEVGLILITHGHPDHTSGALSVSRRTGARIVAHPDDTKTHPDGQVSMSYMGVFDSLPVPLPFVQRTPVNELVEDGQRLKLPEEIEVIHTPGHTPGSVCYLLGERGVLFTGDTVFSDGNSLSRSVPFPGSDRRDYRESLSRLATREFGTLCGGHGVPLLQDASDRLRDLLAARPEPPSWGSFLLSIPRRLYRGASLRGELG